MLYRIHQPLMQPLGLAFMRHSDNWNKSPKLLFPHFHGVVFKGENQFEVSLCDQRNKPSLCGWSQFLKVTTKATREYFSYNEVASSAHVCLCFALEWILVQRNTVPQYQNQWHAKWNYGTYPWMREKLHQPDSLKWGKNSVPKSEVLGTIQGLGLEGHSPN